MFIWGLVRLGFFFRFGAIETTETMSKERGLSDTESLAF